MADIARLLHMEVRLAFPNMMCSSPYNNVTVLTCFMFGFNMHGHCSVKRSTSQGGRVDEV